MFLLNPLPAKKNPAIEIERKPKKPQPRPNDDDFRDDFDHAKPKRKKRRKSKSQRSAGAFYAGLISFAVVGLILAGLSFTLPALAIVPLLLGLVSAIVGSIWFLKVAFSESTVEGALCLLVSPYSIYFLLNHIEQSLRAFLVSLGLLSNTMRMNLSRCLRAAA